MGQGQTDAARAQLEPIRTSEFLTEKERAELAGMLGKMQPAEPAEPAVAHAAEVPTVAATARDGDALDRFKDRIANLYYESVKAYHAGDMDRAKAGFDEVLSSGLMPARMIETIRGYMADIWKAEVAAGQGNLAAE